MPNKLIKKYKLEEEVTIELREDYIVLKPVVIDPRADWEEIYKRLDGIW